MSRLAVMIVMDSRKNAQVIILENNLRVRLVNMAWDEKEWKKEYAKKNRDKMNTYARDYYQKNKAKHIALVLAWKKKNPDKVIAYATSDKVREQKRLAFTKYSENNREKLRDYNRDWSAKKKLRERNARIVVPNAVDRKFGYRYWIDEEGNLWEGKINREWSKKK